MSEHGFTISSKANKSVLSNVLLTAMIAAQPVVHYAGIRTPNIPANWDHGKSFEVISGFAAGTYQSLDIKEAVPQIQLKSELSRVHDELFGNQVILEHDIQAALTRKRWDLYQ